MDKPLCRVCQHRHRLSDPHVWEADEPKADLSHLAPKRAPRKNKTTRTVQPTEASLSAQTVAQRQALWRQKNREKHNERNRVYRAKLRAKSSEGEDDGPLAS